MTDYWVLKAFIKGGIMTKSLFFGVVPIVMGVIVSIQSGNWAKGMNLAGIIGAILLVFGILISGTLSNGDRTRIDFTLQSEEDRTRKHRWSLYSILAGTPGIVASFVYHLLK